MVLYVVVAIIASVITAVAGFVVGRKSKGTQPDNSGLVSSLQSQISELNGKIKEQEETVAGQSEQIKTLTSERDVQKAHADNYQLLMASQKEDLEKQLHIQKEDFDNRLRAQKEDSEAAALKAREDSQKHYDELRASFNRQVADLKESYDKQLAQAKDGAKSQIDALRQMNKEQVDSQLKLIKEQMQTTSEEILKRRQEELGERNREQVSKIIDPLQQSLKDMKDAFDKSKAQQSEALTRLDETIKVNMQKSAALGETADRLTRALTGEVKVQGNFGELKLKQLLEDLELKEG